MMKVWFIAFILIFSVSFAWAQEPWHPLETTDEARQRHSAERYETYEQHGYQAPLGGYHEPLGDRAPYGTERPGFTSPKEENPYLFNPHQEPDSRPQYGR